jgi:DNA repair protein RadC
MSAGNSALPIHLFFHDRSLEEPEICARNKKTRHKMNYPVISRPIHTWAAEDRPREKMMERGIQSLTDAELVATLLATGTREQSAISLARHIIEHFGGLANLSRAEAEALMQLNGVGQAKSATIMAAFELARRNLAQENRMVKFSGSPELSRYLIPKIGDLPYEVFYVIFLDRRNFFLGEKEMYRGGSAGVTVDARYLYKQVLASTASSIIVCHNHPSGRPTPSNTDDELTQHLVSISEVVGVPLIDHIIVTHKLWYSYADQGVLTSMKAKAKTAMQHIMPVKDDGRDSKPRRQHHSGKGRTYLGNLHR